MTLLITTNKAKKICDSYDSEDKLVGTHVLPATATSSVSTASPSSGDLRFHYDDNGNRVKLINEDGDVYYFVPAVTPRPGGTLPREFIIVEGVIVGVFVIATLPEDAIIVGGLCAARALAC